MGEGDALMIVGGYSLDLYCDSLMHPRFTNRLGQFSGADRSDCIKLAKEAGWLFHFRQRTVICPDCAKKAKRLKP